MNLLKSVEEPDLLQTLNNRDVNVFDKLNCHLIGVIQSFDVTNQTASIQIVYKKQLATSIVSYPLLIDCPVVIISGGIASLRMPIAVGDTCLVLFNDKDIDNWFTNGQISLPNSVRKHDLSDGIALVGIRSLQNKISDYTNTEAGIVYDKGEIMISTSDAKVVYDISEMLVSSSVASLTNDKAKVSISANKIDIANDVQTLKSLISSLIDTLKALQTIPAVVGSPLTLDPTVIAQLDAIKTNFGALLK